MSSTPPTSQTTTPPTALNVWMQTTSDLFQYDLLVFMRGSNDTVVQALMLSTGGFSLSEVAATDLKPRDAFLMGKEIDLILEARVMHQTRFAKAQAKDHAQASEIDTVALEAFLKEFDMKPEVVLVVMPTTPCDFDYVYLAGANSNGEDEARCSSDWASWLFAVIEAVWRKDSKKSRSFEAPTLIKPIIKGLPTTFKPSTETDAS